MGMSMARRFVVVQYFGQSVLDEIGVMRRPAGSQSREWSRQTQASGVMRGGKVTLKGCCCCCCCWACVGATAVEVVWGCG